MFPTKKKKEKVLDEDTSHNNWGMIVSYVKLLVNILGFDI